MTTIHIVTATHFDQPGVKVSAHKTAQGARKRAYELTTKLIANAGLTYAVTEVNWTRAVAYLNSCGRDCDVDVATVEIEP